MSIKKKMIALAGNIMMSCEKATLLMSRQQYEKLSLGNKLHLKIHFLTCNACKNFYKQITFLNNSLKGMNKKLDQGEELFRIAPDQKERLEKELRDKLKE